MAVSKDDHRKKVKILPKIRQIKYQQRLSENTSVGQTMSFKNRIFLAT